MDRVCVFSSARAFESKISTLLPVTSLQEHLGEVEELRRKDLADGAGYVEVPGALASTREKISERFAGVALALGFSRDSSVCP
jgi:hypothetical protein